MSSVTDIELHGEAEQVAFGGRLAAVFEAPLLVYLDGDLGAGKTTLVRGLLRALGHQGAVKSPTYTLIEPYAIAGRTIYHLDLYRLGDPGELEYLGLREMLAEDALILVEWPERGAGWLPPADVLLHIDLVDGGRRVQVTAGTERGERRLSYLQYSTKNLR